MTVLLGLLAVGWMLAAPAQSDRRLPVTIQVMQDVDVKTSERRPDGSVGQERGSLYSSKAFRIKKGQRFQMIKLLGEGECRIQFEKKIYDLSSCPWLEGFTDHEKDIYKIIQRK